MLRIHRQQWQSPYETDLFLLMIPNPSKLGEENLTATKVSLCQFSYKALVGLK